MLFRSDAAGNVEAAHGSFDIEFYLEAPQPTLTVTQPVNRATLTVTGITASNRPYDGTTAAALNTSGAMLAGVLSGDSVSLGGTALGAFIDPNAGNGKTVTITGLTLAAARRATTR